MILILIALALAAVAINYLWRVRSLPPHKQRAGYIRFFIGLAVLAVIILTMTGRMHWLGAAITGAFVFLRQVLPWVIRALPFLNKLRQQQAGEKGQSAIRTTHLSATLDHTSGTIEGEVSAGPHVGWLLSELSVGERESLLELEQTGENESAEVLQADVDRR